MNEPKAKLERGQLSELALEILAREAEMHGITTPQQVTRRMNNIIARNNDRLDYLHRVNRDHSRDAQIDTDNRSLALGIEMLAQAYGTLED